MKAWLLKDFGLDNLVQGETETPAPQAGELLVKVGAYHSISGTRPSLTASMNRTGCPSR